MIDGSRLLRQIIPDETGDQFAGQGSGFESGETDINSHLQLCEAAIKQRGHLTNELKVANTRLTDATQRLQRLEKALSAERDAVFTSIARTVGRLTRCVLGVMTARAATLGNNADELHRHQRISSFTSLFVQV